MVVELLSMERNNGRLLYTTSLRIGEKRVWIILRAATQPRQNNSDNQNKEKGKEKESLQSGTTPDPGHHMGK